MTELQRYIKVFKSLKVNRARAVSPHKMCMLLAVMDLFDADPQRANRLEFEPQLLDRFRTFFDAVRQPGDHPNPHLPFFHLRSDGFWKLKARPGREQALEAMTSVRTGRQITENIESVSLDDDLYRLLQDEDARGLLSEAIVVYWFDRSSDELRELVRRGRQVNRYETRLRGLQSGMDARELPPAYIRDPAFRRVVLQAYDYRCAATGTRIILPDESVMVQAAHIEPFVVSGNDDPRNGLALTPDMHWAMDRHVIAPGPDYKWHVSRQVDRRLPENALLARLHGTDLILPREQRLWPKQDYLAWRQRHLV